MEAIPGAPQISLLGIGCIHNRLCVCHIVDSSNAPVNYSKFVQHDLDNWSQAIGGT